MGCTSVEEEARTSSRIGQYLLKLAMGSATIVSLAGHGMLIKLEFLAVTAVSHYVLNGSIYFITFQIN
jgi:hypothetical protein